MRAGIIDRIEVWRRRNDERLAFPLHVSQRLPCILRTDDTDSTRKLIANSCLFVGHMKSAKTTDRTVETLQIDLKHPTELKPLQSPVWARVVDVHRVTQRVRPLGNDAR